MSKSSDIQEGVLQFLNDGQNHSVHEIKNYLQENQISNYTEGQFAGSLNTMIKNGSITKVERGVYKMQYKTDSMMKCFIVSAIGEEGTETRKRADKVFKYILSPVCEEVDFEPIRVDRLNKPDFITQTIIDSLEKDELVIADITDHNPNVFYEIGYRSAIKQPMILLKDKHEKLPFDIAGIRAFDYDLGDLDSVSEIKARLIQTIESISFNDIQTENAIIDKANKNASMDTQLLPLLYDIKDDISQLKDEIREKDTETIQAIVKASISEGPAESPETAIIKAIFPELIKNPDSLKTIIELGQLSSKKK